MIGRDFLYGAAYYPEHWPRRLWARDARRMQRAGFNVVRVGEFAWWFLEPQEGRFDFAWLDDALDVLARHGIRAIVGTPTATIPAWMAHKYPHVMALTDAGTRRPWGIRKDYCTAHPDFRRLALRVVEQLARHFAGDERVIGFQTDNEFDGLRCRCEVCLGRFREFLRRRYRTIDRLNREYGAWFWGAMYNSFEEVRWPAPDYPNPSFGLDLRRFASAMDVEFQHEQVKVLRRHCPDKPITHNLMGLFPWLDYYELSGDLDFVSWDNYPRTDTADRMHEAALAHAVMWSMKRRNFLVMEQQSGPGGWVHFWPQPAPGEMSMLAWQAIARGADGIVYFRWRTSIGGQEQYWHGVLNHDDVPRRRYREAAELGRTLPKLSRLLRDTEPVAEAAIYNNYEQIWATDHQVQVQHDPVKFAIVMREIASALTALGADFGAFGDPRALKGCRLVLCPPLYLTDPKLVKALAAFVRRGGHLVLTARSGVKTINNRNVMQPLPGALRDLAGVEVEEYAAVPAGADWQIELPGGARIAAKRIREWLVPKAGAEVVGVHRGDYMDGEAAIARKPFGKGVVWYVGTLPAARDWRALLERVLPQARVEHRTDLPRGVERARRAGARRELTFYMNHTGSAQTVNLPRRARELLSGRTVAGPLTLGPYGVAVLNARA